MAWVRFTADFDFSPKAKNGWVTLAYKAGTVENVTRECAQMAIEVGKAERIQAPRGGADAPGD